MKTSQKRVETGMDKIRQQLDAAYQYYNRPEFIPTDPICIPHAFSKAADIEIAGLFAALFAWGQRPTIIAKSRELMARMDNAPADFILNHQATDLQKLLGFVHRTFNETDLLYLVDFLQRHYRRFDSLEDAFLEVDSGELNPDKRAFQRLAAFHKRVFAVDYAPQRTRKHIATPASHSSCKRLNMYLRWMVRKDENGVDFGLWKQIQPSELIMPMDLHVQRVATRLGLLPAEKSDWKHAILLTQALRELDAADPVKYDFALFGLGVLEKGFNGDR